LATTNNGTTASETFGTTSPVTGSAPTLSRPTGSLLQTSPPSPSMIDAGTGVTLSGAGTLQAYVYDPSVAVWARMPAFDLSVTGTTRTQAFQAFQVLGPRNARIKWVPSAVTFSAGSAGVTVYQLGYLVALQGRYA
jgi:hypothetical protein